jgi:hypothetical protein
MYIGKKCTKSTLEELLQSDSNKKLEVKKIQVLVPGTITGKYNTESKANKVPVPVLEVKKIQVRIPVRTDISIKPRCTQSFSITV